MSAAAGTATVQWEDAKGFMDQLIHMMEEEETEVRVLEEMREIRARLEGALEAHEGTMQEAVRALSSRIDAATEAISRESEIQELRDAAAGVEGEIEAVQAELRRLISTRDATEASVAALREQVEGVQARIADAKTRIDEVVPQLKHQMSLYAHITNIRWDFDSPNVKGVFAPPAGKGTPKAFNFSPDGMSEVDVADRLWGLLAASTAGGTGGAAGGNA